MIEWVSSRMVSNERLAILMRTPEEEAHDDAIWNEAIEAAAQWIEHDGEDGKYFAKEIRALKRGE